MEKSLDQVETDLLNLINNFDEDNLIQFKDIIKLACLFLKVDDLGLANLLHTSRPTITRWKEELTIPHKDMRYGIIKSIAANILKDPSYALVEGHLVHKKKYDVKLKMNNTFKGEK